MASQQSTCRCTTWVGVRCLGWRLSAPQRTSLLLSSSSASEWRVVSESLRPDEATYAALEEGLETTPGSTFDPKYLVLDQDDLSVTLNGARWRWFLLDARDCELLDFVLVPDLELEPVVTRGAWFSGSMTGMAWEAGLYRSGPVIYAYEGDDAYGGTTRLTYGEQDLDAHAEAWLTVSEDPYDPTCPLADNSSDQPDCVYTGWDVSLEVSDMLSDETVEAFLTAAWQPCALHAPECDQEQAGKTWGYADGAWAPIASRPTPR